MLVAQVAQYHCLKHQSCHFFISEILALRLHLGGKHLEEAYIITKMLDSFEILTTSGVVLWSRAYVPINSSLINGFIRDVFIEEKIVLGTGATDDAPAAKNPAYKKEKHTLKWASLKDLGLIFIVGTLSLVIKPS